MYGMNNKYSIEHPVTWKAIQGRQGKIVIPPRYFLLFLFPSSTSKVFFKDMPVWNPLNQYFLNGPVCECYHGTLGYFSCTTTFILSIRIIPKIYKFFPEFWKHFIIWIPFEGLQNRPLPSPCWHCLSLNTLSSTIKTTPCFQINYASNPQNYHLPFP